ncbi:TetR/AcrR family transcriptional regulator [Yinghuangia soli]|uniref:TetR/AcrR family transcriptional regulator n=1 Tax=Yinghuangia soli TaxID=2908204 RepID=A0AA41QAT4_9ACTN|nr:TetR/AcrR family transcriptional regulator [Yinghuangia soli]MCF2534050.1 TetR/AcrR family transcriptional regulator [Yinghuangia soli]
MATRRPPNRKAQILEAAGVLFRERGYHNVSVAEVAEAAGITAPAVYRHFRNKEELLLDAVLGSLDAVEGRIRDAAGLDDMLRAMASAAVTRRSVAALWEREARHLPDAQRGLVQNRASDVTERLAGRVREARPDVEAADSRLVALAMLAVMASTSRHRLSLPRRRFEALLHQLGERVLRCPLPAPAATAAPRPPRAVAALQPSRREQVLAEATRLFDERGFQSVAMADIGEAVGIVGSGVYRHFATKTDILIAATSRGGDRMLVAFDQAVSRASSPRNAVEAAFRSHVQLGVEQSHVIGVITNEREQLPERERTALRRFQREYLEMWVRLLDQAVPGRDPVETRMIVVAAQGMARYVVRWARPAPDQELVERVVAMGTALLLPD